LHFDSWSYLEIETFPTYPDEVQAYAAGLAEGRATRQLIKWHWLNTVDGYCKNVQDYCSRLSDYVSKNFQWVKGQIEQNPYDPYWRQVDFLWIFEHSGIKNIVNIGKLDANSISRLRRWL